MIDVVSKRSKRTLLTPSQLKTIHVSTNYYIASNLKPSLAPPRPTMMMQVSSVLLSVLSVVLLVDRVHAFVPPQQLQRAVSFVRLAATETTNVDSTAEDKTTSGATKQKTIGLLTFDLDDTLYPIAPVIDEANAAFARAMARFGYEGLTPMDIVETGMLIRQEIANENAMDAAILTHTQIRELSIRREMENIMLSQKLKETADDWATPVSDLADIVVANAKK